eukprot:scaffold88501_cov55-Phaeocystis_antarctica.AAC.1
MEANMAGTRRASGWRRAGRRGADGPPWSGRACSGWGPKHLVWVHRNDVRPGRTIARAPRRAARRRRDSATTLLVAFPPTALAVTAEAAVFGATTVFVKIPCRLGPIWAICNDCDISVVSTVYFTKVPSS